MSSMVLFDKDGIVVEWHKGGYYTVTHDGFRRQFRSRESAMRAARDRVRAKLREKEKSGGTNRSGD